MARQMTSRLQGSTNILQVDGRACEARISADLACSDETIIWTGRALIPERVSSNGIKIHSETAKIHAFLSVSIELMKKLNTF